MCRAVAIIFFLFVSTNLFSQINYYVGFDLLSTNSKVIENNNENNQNSINFSTYIGNEINLNNTFRVFIDIVYQNNKNILKKLAYQDTRFELHQTISML